MRTKVWIILGCLLLVSISGICFAQYPQQNPPMAGGAPGGGGGVGGGGGMMGQGGMSMMQMMPMMQTMHPAIAVDDTAVYIVRGNQVLKLDKRTLRVIKTSMLPPAPRDDMWGMGGMQGSGMGMGGSMGGPGSGGMGQRPNMQSMMNDMAQSTPDQFDRMYLQNMMHQYDGEIEMSNLALDKATHPELRRFARGIIDSQTSQSDQFSSLLGDWYQESAQPMTMPMDDRMAAPLRDLNGRDFEMQYMQSMIQHHQMAIQMSDMAQQKAAHPELRTAGSKIVSARSAEIQKLQEWLSAWYGMEQ